MPCPYGCYGAELACCWTNDGGLKSAATKATAKQRPYGPLSRDLAN